MGTQPMHIDEQLDWKQIDQLHAATLQFSSTSLEMKKLCVGLATAVPVLLAKFTHDSLNPAFFIAGIAIIVPFWLVDAHAYFYQEKLRARMADIAKDIKKVRGAQLFVGGIGIPLDETRTSRTRLRRSLFNSSQLLYLFLFLIDLGLWLAFRFGRIG